jgi:hypothetical protein
VGCLGEITTRSEAKQRRTEGGGAACGVFGHRRNVLSGERPTGQVAHEDVVAEGGQSGSAPHEGGDTERLLRLEP